MRCSNSFRRRRSGPLRELGSTPPPCLGILLPPAWSRWPASADANRIGRRGSVELEQGDRDAFALRCRRRDDRLRERTSVPLVTCSPSFLSEGPLALASGKEFSSLSGHVRINSRRKLKHLDELANQPLHKNRPLGVYFRYSGLSNRAGTHKLPTVPLNAVQRDRQGNTRTLAFTRADLR